MNPVVHFEMPYDDPARMQKFYQAAFDWKMQMLGQEMGNYVVAKTGPTTADGWPTEVGRINGGFFARTGDKPDQYPSVVISVDDIKAGMDAVRRAGGEVLGDPMTIPGVGEYVSIRDSEGNRVGILEPLPMPKAKVKAKPKAKKPAAARRRRPRRRRRRRPRHARRSRACARRRRRSHHRLVYTKWYMPIPTRTFLNGRSTAVRIPAEFGIKPGEEVLISQEKDGTLRLARAEAVRWLPRRDRAHARGRQ